MIEAAIFDLGGVVFRMDWEAVSRDWEGRLGLEPGAHARAIFGGGDELVLIGRMTEDEYWSKVVLPRLGRDDAWRQEFEADLDRREALQHELLDFVGGLRPRYRTGVISNAWSGTRARLEAQGVHNYFDDIVISAEVGVAKPDPRIFEVALERLGVEPGQAVFVDDVERNVDAARAVGLDGIVCVSTAQVIADVSARLAG